MEMPRTVNVPDRFLLVVLAAPPTSSGSVTLNRVKMASAHLGYSTYRIVNLLNMATTDVNNIAEVGADREGWLGSRLPISNGARGAGAALLAYGVSEPLGVAREFFREQVRWLRDELEASGIESIITFGGRTRHPSRWQRGLASVPIAETFEARCRAAYKIESLSSLPDLSILSRINREEVTAASMEDRAEVIGNLHA